MSHTDTHVCLFITHPLIYKPIHMNSINVPLHLYTPTYSVRQNEKDMSTIHVSIFSIVSLTLIFHICISCTFPHKHFLYILNIAHLIIYEHCRQTDTCFHQTFYLHMDGIAQLVFWQVQDTKCEIVR